MPKPNKFHFENVWIKESEYLNLVKNSWECVAGLELMEKIQLCSLKLKEWGGGETKEYNLKIKYYKDRFRKFGSRRDIQDIQSYNAGRWEYLNLLEKTGGVLEATS